MYNEGKHSWVRVVVEGWEQIYEVGGASSAESGDGHGTKRLGDNGRQ